MGLAFPPISAVKKGSREPARTYLLLPKQEGGLGLQCSYMTINVTLLKFYDFEMLFQNDICSNTICQKENILQKYIRFCKILAKKAKAKQLKYPNYRPPCRLEK